MHKSDNTDRKSKSRGGRWDAHELTKSAVARKYGVSTKELADMNDIAPDTMLQRGQRLTVPNR